MVRVYSNNKAAVVWNLQDFISFERQVVVDGEILSKVAAPLTFVEFLEFLIGI